MSMQLRAVLRPWYAALKKLRLELGDDVWLHFGEAPIEKDAAATRVVAAAVSA